MNLPEQAHSQPLALMICAKNQPLLQFRLFAGWFQPALVLLALALAPIAGAQPPEQQNRLDSLGAGSLTERRDALGWLAKHGDFSGAETVVKSLKDEDHGVRRLAEETLWALWSRSGSIHVDALLETGGNLISQGRLFQAVQFFDEVISEMPEFAEGYNKRATAWYLMGSYKKSLADISQTLERNPFHFGALSGAGYCMIRLKRFGEAAEFFQRALEINPNLEGVRALNNEVMKELKRRSI
jgi:tetratricopeptide (TPR) repeat protein